MLGTVCCNFFIGNKRILLVPSPSIYLFIYLFHFSTSFILCGKFGSPDLGKATAAARAALPIPNSVCGVFMCANKSMVVNAWDR